MLIAITRRDNGMISKPSHDGILLGGQCGDVHWDEDVDNDNERVICHDNDVPTNASKARDVARTASALETSWIGGGEGG